MTTPRRTGAVELGDPELTVGQIAEPGAMTLVVPTLAAKMAAFGVIGLTGFLPNLAALHLLVAGGMHYLPAEIMANQFGVVWNFLLIEVLLFRERRRHRHWSDRFGRFALLANADLLLRIPLIALFVAQWGMAVLPATALALLTTFVVRFAATEALVYLPRRGAPGRGRAGARARPGPPDRVRAAPPPRRRPRAGAREPPKMHEWNQSR